MFSLGTVFCQTLYFNDTYGFPATLPIAEPGRCKKRKDEKRQDPPADDEVGSQIGNSGIDGYDQKQQGNNPDDNHDEAGVAGAFEQADIHHVQAVGKGP